MNFKRFCSQKLHKQLEKLSSHLFQNMKKEFKRCTMAPSLCNNLYMSSLVNLFNRFIPRLRRICLSHTNFLDTRKIYLSHMNFLDAMNFLHVGSRSLMRRAPSTANFLHANFLHAGSLNCEFSPRELPKPHIFSTRISSAAL
jgi:hypothetical protein